MFLLSYRYVNHKEDAEEIVSDGFIKILLNLPKVEFRNVASFEAWMRKIMVNECLMFLRKRKKTIENERGFESLSTHSNIEIEQEAAHLLELILSLPEGYRTVFNLYVIEGYSHKEISKKLSIGESTSRSQLTKARNLLKKKYQNSQT